MMYKVEDGWRKVAERGGSYVVAVLFNIVTGESDSVCVRDYDYADCSHDNDYWYDMAIDKDALRAYQKANGIISVGDTVKVVKGRKIPIGYSGVVVNIRPVTDRYGRQVADYVVFDDGKATSITNCVLVA